MVQIQSYSLWIFKKKHPDSITHSELLKGHECTDPIYPIVFIHGLLMFGEESPLIYGHTDFYADYLRKLNPKIDIYCPTIGPVHGWKYRSLEAIIKTKLKYPQWSVHNPVHLIGHSLGGLTVVCIGGILQNPAKHVVNTAIVRDIIDKYRMGLGSKYAGISGRLTTEKINFKQILDVLFVDQSYGDKMIISITTLCGALNNCHFVEDKITIDITRRRAIPDRDSIFYLFSVGIRLYAYYAPSLLKNILNFDYGLDIYRLGIRSFWDCFTNVGELTGEDYVMWDLYNPGNAEIWRDISFSKNISYLFIAFQHQNALWLFNHMSSILNLIYLINHPKFTEENDGLISVSTQLKKGQLLNRQSYFYGRSIYYAIEYGDHMDALVPKVLDNHEDICRNLLKYLNIMAKHREKK